MRLTFKPDIGDLDGNICGTMRLKLDSRWEDEPRGGSSHDPTREVT